jgi:hypothetical protein
MNIIYIILIFCIVLFLYIHVFFHLKTSDDLEIYEIDYPSKDKLEEICDLRQPILFDYMNERILESCNRQEILDNYGAFDIKIRNLKANNEIDNEIYVPLAFSNALNLMKEDTSCKYLVENNSDFLEETNMIKIFKYNDAFLRPYMVSNCMYDYMSANKGVQTPFRYELNYRNYLLVSEGSVKIKLAAPKSSKYLYEQKDYENFEFISKINPWDVKSQYKADFDKIKCLDITIKKGQILFLPAYWWYSIEFGDESSICSFKYRTYMNTIAISPHLIITLLQGQNVKRNNLKKIKVEGSSTKSLITEEKNASIDADIEISLPDISNNTIN